MGQHEGVWRRVVVVVVLGLAVAVADATPAGACSCAPQTDAEQLASAEQVYVGELVAAVPVVEPTDTLFPYRAALRFEVDEVFAGEVGRTAEVWTTPGSGSVCGLGANVGERWLVIATRDLPDDDYLFTGSCSASQLLRGPAPGWVGEGHPPDPDVPAPPDRSARDDLAAIALAAAGAAGVVAVGLRLGARRSRLSPA